ncbi:MAG: glycosyltransferase family 4 protein [Myxococcales bacterium]
MKIAMFGIRGVPTHLPGVAKCAHQDLLTAGTEKAAEQLSWRLAARGHDVTVFCRKGRTLLSAPEWEGVKLVHLPCIRSKHLEAVAHTALSAAEVVRRGGFDVAHIHAIGPNLFSFVPRLAGIGTVATVHGLDFRRQKWGPVAKLALRTGSRAATTFPHRTIVVSKSLQAYYAEKGCEVAFVPNGVDDPIRRPINALAGRGLVEGGYLLFLGRLTPEKGVDLLLEAFRGVRTPMKLLVAGGGTYSGDYIGTLKRLAGMDPRVVLEAGGLYGDERLEALSNAAGFVLPSHIEGLSIALLEAMRYGLAPLVSDIPENAEVVAPFAGPTFRDGDVASLERALARLCDDAGERAEVGRRAAENATQYSWDRVVEQTERVYEEAAAAAGRRVRLSGRA